MGGNMTLHDNESQRWKKTRQGGGMDGRGRVRVGDNNFVVRITKRHLEWFE